MKECHICEGTGLTSMYSPTFNKDDIRPCANCNGTGKINYCSECDGHGIIDSAPWGDQICPKCNGMGRLEWL